MDNNNKKEILVKVKNLKKYFNVGNKQTLKAVDDVSFNIYKGETLSLVGESGCGKTTCARTVMGLYEKTSGSIKYKNQELSDMRKRDKRDFRRSAQIILQDPYASLNPRMSVGDIIAEGIDIHKVYKTKKEREERIFELLETVGLNKDHITRYPHEFSGGQRQRISIARGLALNPEFITCDEPISALDVSIQAQIINLLMELQEKQGFTYLVIAHDLEVVRHMSDRIGVMYLGNLVEITTSEELFKNTLHPYSKVLLGSRPIPDPKIARNRNHEEINMEMMSPINPKNQCMFANRCQYAKEICFNKKPALKEHSPGHKVSCHLF